MRSQSISFGHFSFKKSVLSVVFLAAHAVLAAVAITGTAVPVPAIIAVTATAGTAAPTVGRAGGTAAGAGEVVLAVNETHGGAVSIDAQGAHGIH